MFKKITASIVSIVMAAALTAVPAIADVNEADIVKGQDTELTVTEAKHQSAETGQQDTEAEMQIMEDELQTREPQETVTEEVQKEEIAPEASVQKEEIVPETAVQKEESEKILDDEPGPAVEISTYENLAAFIAGINDGTIEPTTDAVLLADITVPENVGNDWVPLAADWDHAYQGVFDGGGYTVSGINISRTYPEEWSEGTQVHNYTAFISFLGEDGEVKDLNVNADILDVNDVAGIVSQNLGSIYNCSFTGTLASNIYPNNAGEKSPFYPEGVFNDSSGETGCIAAANMGEIVNCRTTENTDTRIYRGGGCCGGIVGTNREGGSVTKCVNYAGISVGTTVYKVLGVYSGGGGGIVGVQQLLSDSIIVDPEKKPFIDDCVNFGTITCEQGAGGICGISNSGDIFGCQNNGTITGVERTWGGGIVGYMGTILGLKDENASRLQGNINLGEINPMFEIPEGETYQGTYIGGIAGYIEDAFNLTGKKWAPVKVTDNANGGNVYGRFSVGGVIGLASNGLDPETNETHISEQVNLGQVTGNNNVAGIAGSCPGVISACCNYGKVTIIPRSEYENDKFYAGGIAGDCGITGNVDTSVNLGGIFCEEGENKEVYIGAGAGSVAGEMTGSYYSVNTCGDARRLIGAKPDLLRGALSLPDMSDKAAEVNMPELFDGKSGHHPTAGWQIMQNEVIDGVTYLMQPQIGDWPLSAADIYEHAGVDIIEHIYSISAAEVSAAASYTGNVIIPEPTVDLNGLILTEGVDYEVFSWPYINAGTYPLIVKGKGIYADMAVGSLKVKKAASTITLADKSATYSGKPVSASKASVRGSSGKVTYKYYTDAECKNEVAASKVVNAGTYYAKATVAADANYRGATSAAAKITIKKASQTLKVKQTKAQKTITLKAADVKKKDQTIAFSKVATVTGNKTTLSYKKTKGADAFTVDSRTGKITVKKGTKNNTYTLKIKVTAEKTGNYKSASETVTVQIRIR